MEHDLDNNCPVTDSANSDDGLASIPVASTSNGGSIKKKSKRGKWTIDKKVQGKLIAIVVSAIVVFTVALGFGLGFGLHKDIIQYAYSQKYDGYIAYVEDYAMEELKIPSSYKDKAVVAFRGPKKNKHKNLKKVELPDTLLEIMEGAFAGNAQLQSINIPSGVIEIGEGIFSGCSSLKNITLPFVGARIAGNTSANTSTLFGYIFGREEYDGSVAIEQRYGITSEEIETYFIPKTLSDVTVLGGDLFYGAFYGCDYLINLTLKDSDIAIGPNVFWGCDCLTIYCEFEDSIPQSNNWDSNWNENKCPIIWNSMENQKDNDGTSYFLAANGIRYALKNGEALVIRQSKVLNGEITIPSHVIHNGSYEVTGIVTKAFFQCEDVTSINLFANILNVGDESFANCSNLLNINIPSSVKYIGDKAFNGSNSLIIYCEADSKQSGWNSGWNYSNRPVVWNYGGKRGITESGLKWVLINGGSISISGYDGINQEIVIPKTINDYDVTDIAFSAFKGCNGLTSITLPFVGATKGGTINTHFGYIFGASSYLNNALNVPSTLKNVIITDVKIINEYVFYGCKNLTNIEIPNEVTSIGDGAFYGCSNLTNIAVPSSVKSIGNRAFYGCNRLEDINILKSVTNIGYGAFEGCNSLKSITLPFLGASKGGTINTHFGYIFGASTYVNNASKVPATLQDVIITGGESISADTFYGCSNLTNIKLPSNYKRIGAGAFYNCTSIRSIEIPSSVIDVGDNAFYGCSGLTRVYIKDVASWCKIKFGNAFANPLACAHNLYLNDAIVNTLSLSVESIGDYAFYGCSSILMGAMTINTKNIGAQAFSNCSNLVSINIPNTVKNVGALAFSNCSNLTIFCQVSVAPSTWAKDWAIYSGHYNNRVKAVKWGV